MKKWGRGQPRPGKPVETVTPRNRDPMYAGEKQLMCYSPRYRSPPTHRRRISSRPRLPRRSFGEPVMSGTYEGHPISVPVGWRPPSEAAVGPTPRRSFDEEHLIGLAAGSGAERSSAHRVTDVGKETTRRRPVCPLAAASLRYARRAGWIAARSQGGGVEQGRPGQASADRQTAAAADHWHARLWQGGSDDGRRRAGRSRFPDDAE